MNKHHVLALSVALVAHSLVHGAAATVRPCTMSHEQRMRATDNPVTQKLLNIMYKKQPNLILSADVTKCDELLQMVGQVAPDICAVKIHIDILEDLTPEFLVQLRQLADREEFLLLADRKFCDIGNTVKQQCAGKYKIREWADMVTAHAISGPDTIKAIQEAATEAKRPIGILLIAQMSSTGNLIDERYTKQVVQWGEQYKNCVVGFIAQESCSTDAGLLTCTPGVSLAQTKDGLGQQYNTPEHVIGKKGSDLIIVGRAICNAKDRKQAAIDHKNPAWLAYSERIKERTEVTA